MRIGTAEIYRQVEQLDEVVESLVIGQQWDHDERIVLFVRLRDGVDVDRRARAIASAAQIRENTTPRHVPARIVQVTEIPRTKSGKIVELAVRDVVHGRAGEEHRKRSQIPKRSISSGTGLELQRLVEHHAFGPHAVRLTCTSYAVCLDGSTEHMIMTSSVILSACRTPIGSFGGVFKDLSAADLGAIVIREAIAARASTRPTSATSSWAACCRPARA